jgi:formate--tetrahydrofolate ligase
MTMPTSLEIAQSAHLQPVVDVAEQAGILEEELELYGRYKAKVSHSVLDRLADTPDGKLIAVTAITPTPAGEGKTTTAIGLAEGLGLVGENPVLCLREPSLGPVFGIKGGAAGGGYSQVVPMEDLNLHFTGDLHAITAANNLLAAMIESHVMQGNDLDLDPQSITWRRCLDMNDRALRQVIVGLGGKINGSPRESGFDITAASEVMAILAMARDLDDLRSRLGAITVGSTRSGEPVTAEQLHAAGGMTVLLKDAIKPNLVQTLEGQPAFVHAGPFANIAHGNSSLSAARIGLKLGDYVITEGGFASDLGMEKFLDIVCRVGGLTPSAVVLVASLRALEHHGDGDFEKGADNLERHLQIARAFGLNAVVAVNGFPGDSKQKLDRVRKIALERGAWAAEINEGFELGGAGAARLAETVVEATRHESRFEPVYSLEQTIPEKIESIAVKVYGADGVDLLPAARAKVELYTKLGLDRLPICMAKTHLSLSHDPKLKNAPTGFTVPVRDIRPYTGAGWLVALCGEMQTMPGLGKHPAAFDIDVAPDGTTVGLF